MPSWRPSPIKGAGSFWVLLETRAARIEVKAGTVTGVLDAQGRRYPARAVIANANVPSVFNRLIPQKEVPDEYLKKLSRLHPSLSSFIVWLGLNREIKGVEGYEIFLRGRKTADEDYAACLKGRLDQTGMAITLYDNLFNGFSLPGPSTVTIMTLSGYEFWKQFEKDYFAGRKKAYQKAKELLAKTPIEKTEARVIPKLKSIRGTWNDSEPRSN